MIKVKLFGLFRDMSDKYEFEIEASRLDKLLKELAVISNVPYKELKNAVIFINKTAIDRLKGFKTPLTAGDEVAILSPASGG